MKKLPYLPSHQSGFTLIEVVVAMSILAIGIMGTSTLLYRVTRNNTMGNLTTQANLLAESKMEELKHTATVSTLTNGNDVVDALGSTGGAGNFTRTWTITNPMGGNISRFITVAVTAQSGMGQRTITVNSLTQGSGI